LNSCQKTVLLWTRGSHEICVHPKHLAYKGKDRLEDPVKGGWIYGRIVKLMASLWRKWTTWQEIKSSRGVLYTSCRRAWLQLRRGCIKYYVSQTAYKSKYKLGAYSLNPTPVNLYNIIDISYACTSNIIHLSVSNIRYISDY